MFYQGCGILLLLLLSAHTTATGVRQSFPTHQEIRAAWPYSWGEENAALEGKLTGPFSSDAVEERFLSSNVWLSTGTTFPP